MVNIREVIQDAFERSGLSERELARRMDCSPSQVNYLMSGERRWNEDWIPKFCQALGISLEKLVCSKAVVPYFNDEWMDVHNDLELALSSPDSRELIVGMIRTAAEQVASKKAGGNKGEKAS